MFDGNGEVSWQEFEKRMNDPDVKLLFAKVGLSVSDAINFFALLDVDGSTSLEIDEFVMGCMRLKNNTGTVDVECSIVETKQMLSKLMSRQGHPAESVKHRAGLRLCPHETARPRGRRVDQRAHHCVIGPDGRPLCASEARFLKARSGLSELQALFTRGGVFTQRRDHALQRVWVLVFCAASVLFWIVVLERKSL